MGLYQRRRPSPIQILPARVRRQDAPSGTKSPKSPDSPKSSNSPDSPDSPDSPKSSKLPSATGSSQSSNLPPPPTQTAVPSGAGPQVSNTVNSSSPPPPPASSSETLSKNSSSAVPLTTAQESNSSSRPAPTAAIPSSNASKTEQSSGTTVAPQSTAVGSPLSAASSTGDSSSVVKRPVSSPTPTSQSSSPSLPNSTKVPPPPSETRPSFTNSAFIPAQSELEGEKSGIGRTHHEEKPIMSKGAEAAAITLSIMGFIALIVGIFIFIKRKKRQQNEKSMRHAEDAFNPGNSGSLHAPETAHIDVGFTPSLAHMTKSSTTSDLYGSSHYDRPETVSTNSNRSRIRAPSVAPPQPTPNPFADPPLHKAYDQLRGRPRSTTLTDRGSWIGNPFKDPASERFDPFGELQEKARAERRKYVEDARREAEERQRRELEQDYLEKERMGLSVPGRDERKGSDVTVGGMGVLDRSDSGRYR